MNEAEAFRAQAIHELRLAILALECGEIVSAQNHATCAIHWANEIDPAAIRPAPNVTTVQATSESANV